jgi:hypothetical protein
VHFELNQAEVDQLLCTHLERLRGICTRFREGLGVQPEYLVPVGGPMRPRSFGVWSRPPFRPADRGGEGQLWTVVSGAVEKFESFPDRLAVASGGGPLFNDLGEVVGVLTSNDRHDDAGKPVFALSVESLAPLLRAAGFDRYGD